MGSIVVTGGSGKLGRAVVRDLVAHGHHVLNLDQAPPREELCKTVRIDLTNFGEVAEAILGGIDERGGKFDAVVHLAAIPAPGLFPNARTFKNNVPSTYNVFLAARQAGIKNVVFASSDFKIGDQHAQYGLVPGWGGSQRLPRIVGLRRALDLFFNARWIDAPTALAWGLVNYVVEPDKLADASMAYCTQLASRSRIGLATMKRLARQGLDRPLNEGLEMEQVQISRELLNDDVSEGLAAFEARRPPVFKA